MLKKAPIPVFFLISLGLVLCYWWVSRPAAAVANWQVWEAVFTKQAQDTLMLSDLNAISETTAQTPERFEGVWQQDWQVRAALKGDKVKELNLIPTHKVSEATLSATVGAPRLRLDLKQGYAWVYPQKGLTLYLQDGHLRLLEALPLQP